MKHVLAILLTLITSFVQAVDTTAPQADEHLLLALDAIDNGNTLLAMGHIRVCINTLTMIQAQVSPEVSKEIDKRMKIVTGRTRAAYLNVKAIEYMAHSGQHLQAEPLLKKAIELDPTLPESYNSLAFIEISKLSQAKTKIEWHVQANIIIKLLDKAIELNPKYIDAYSNRGKIYNAMGKIAEAQRDFVIRNSLINHVPIRQGEK